MREARSVVDGQKKIEELFAGWLAQNAPSAQLSELYLCYSEIESFCIRIKVLHSPLLETVDLETIKRVQKTVMENRLFRFSHRKQMKKNIAAMQYYLAFVKSLEKTENDENKSKKNDELVMPELSENNRESMISEVYNNSLEKSELVLDEKHTDNDEEENLNRVKEWLQCKIPMARAEEIMDTLNQFSEYAVDNGITSKNLFQITDFDEVDRLLKISKENRNIREMFHGRLTLLTCGLYNYSLLLHETREKNIIPITSNSKEKQEQLNEQSAEISESSALVETKETLVHDNGLENASEADVKDENSEECSLIVIDFKMNQCLSYTKPVSYTYFGEEHTDISNWTQLYVAVLTSLFKDYPEKLLQMCNTNISGARRIDFGNKTDAETMLAPKRIDDDFYVESNLSATNIASKIRILLDRCNIDYKNLEIKYEKHDSGVPKKNREDSCRNPDLALQSDLKKAVQIDGASNIESFRNWMVNKGLAERTAQSYGSAITNCEQLAYLLHLPETQLYGAGYEASLHLKYSLEKTAEYREVNVRQNNRYRAAFEKYLQYLCETNPQGNIVTENLIDKENTNLPAISCQISEHGKNYAIILEKYFNENGYQPGRAIYRGRFKRYYTALFGRDIPESDEAWEKTLQFIGTERDGRIFPKQDGVQNDLLNEIIENVVSTLNAGASGISLEALYEKYNRRLADSLHIYNQDAMTELLIAKAGHRFTKRYTCLVNGYNNADPNSDIIRVIKEYHEPKTLEQLHEKLWYIPFDRMKYMLVTEPSVVRAEQGCYYYAPNLPVSTEELQQIIHIIQVEIDSVNFVVGTRLVDLIYEKCPEVALNTGMLTPLCVRNSLAYLLREHFSFKSAVISALDSELNMTDVYAEYARERDCFTLDELKEFSEELSVGIYWEAIMGEVVRLSDREFIRKDHITFDIEAIDDILDEQCHGDYMPMKEVSLYLSFPNIGYQWNVFVLSSYLYHTSKKFRLLFQSFSQSSVTGAMVRMDSPITNYYEMIVDALSRSDALRSTKVALQYIVNCGFQQRLAYNDIEKAVQEAKLLREKQIKEEK